jgi:hypothetical protein
MSQRRRRPATEARLSRWLGGTSRAGNAYDDLAGDHHTCRVAVIDAFHHTVYALATGLAYKLLSSRNGTGMKLRPGSLLV